MSVFTHSYSQDYSFWRTESCILGMGRDIPIHTLKTLQHPTTCCFTLGLGLQTQQKRTYYFLHSEALQRYHPYQFSHPESYREIISIQRKENIHTEVRGYLQKHPVNSGRAGLDPRHFFELLLTAHNPHCCCQGSSPLTGISGTYSSSAFLLKVSQMFQVGCRWN